MVKQKTIRVYLLPQDFFMNTWHHPHCPLSYACKRHFNDQSAKAGAVFVWTNGNMYCIKRDDKYGQYWTREIYERVKAAYQQDPRAEKVIYYVELIPVK